MFDRFTDGARDAVVVARDAAIHRGDAEVTPLTLLAGCLRESHYVAARAFATHGVSYADVKARLGGQDGPCTEPHEQRVPLGAAARAAFEASLDEAFATDSAHISTGHLAAAVLGQPDDALAAVLGQLGVSADAVRASVFAVLAGGEAALAAEGLRPFASGRDARQFRRMAARRSRGPRRWGLR